MNRILVVDDEPIIRMLLAENLADAGYTVAAAKNGAEALDRALEQQSDMVVLDLLMPEMDGFMFLRERQCHPNLARVPVVVLSAAGIEDLRQAWHLHATAVLSKPVDLDVLSAVIEHVLREWRREPRVKEPAGAPIGNCPVCNLTVYAQLTDSSRFADQIRSIHQARLAHILSHYATDIAAVRLRRRFLLSYRSA